MSQETDDMTTMTSRAISTANFLATTSQSYVSVEAKKNRRETWDAARRQVILTEVPVLRVESDLCTPSSRTPPKPSLLDILSGKSGILDPSPLVSPAGPPHAASRGVPSSTKTMRVSLTDHQWGGGASGSTSLARAATIGETGRTGLVKLSEESSYLSRTKSCDVKPQNSQGSPDGQQRVRKGVAGRRHSVQILQQQSADGPQKTSSQQAQVPPAAAPDEKQHSRRGTAGRRHSVLGNERESAEGPQRSSSSMAQMYSTASIAAVGRLSTSDVAVSSPTAAALSPGKVVPLKLHVLDDPAGDHSYLKSKSTPLLDVHYTHKHQSLYRSKSGGTDGQAESLSSSSDGGTETESSMSGGITFRRYVPSIDRVDKQAMQRGAAGDCTAYDTLLNASIKAMKGW